MSMSKEFRRDVAWARTLKWDLVKSEQIMHPGKGKVCGLMQVTLALKKRKKKATASAKVTAMQPGHCSSAVADRSQPTTIFAVTGSEEKQQEEDDEGKEGNDIVVQKGLTRIAITDADKEGKIQAEDSTPTATCPKCDMNELD